MDFNNYQSGSSSSSTSSRGCPRFVISSQLQSLNSNLLRNNLSPVPQSSSTFAYGPSTTSRNNHFNFPLMSRRLYPNSYSSDNYQLTVVNSPNSNLGGGVPRNNLYNKSSKKIGRNSQGQMNTRTESGAESNGSGQKFRIAKNNAGTADGVQETPGQSDKENESARENEEEGVSGEESSQKAGSSKQTNLKVALSKVSELAKFHGLQVEYRLINEAGPPHAPIFTIQLTIGNEKYEGTGLSIKKAQTAAATEALEKTSLPKPTPRPMAKRNFNSNGRFQGKGGRSSALSSLSSLARELGTRVVFRNEPIGWTSPSSLPGPPPLSVVSVHVGERAFFGEGRSYGAAKEAGTLIALKALLREKEEGGGGGVGNKEEGGEEGSEEGKNPISVIYEMAHRRGMEVSYEIVKEIGPPHMKQFTVQCKVGEELKTEKEGLTKQQAKKLASEDMIEKLKEIPVSVHSPLDFSFKTLLKAQSKARRKPSTPVLKDIEKAKVSPISRLIQIAHLRKYREPIFIVLSTGANGEEETNGENNSSSEASSQRKRRAHKNHKPHFIIEVKVGPFTCLGEGPNKKAAKKSAADNALVQLGYAPSPPDPTTIKSKDSPKSSTTKKTEAPSSKDEGEGGSSSSQTKTKNSKGGSTGRQIVPGLISLNSNTTLSSINSNSTVSPCSVIKEEVEPEEVKKYEEKVSSVGGTHAAINKLSYLAQLLDVQVSYSDFPKKNEYLSVVSLGTIPPHVSHGIGATLEDARNNAALQLLDELSDKGLDNTHKPSDN